MAPHSLAQIGVNTEAEANNARAEVGVQAGKSIASGDQVHGVRAGGDRAHGDRFVERNGLRCAGRHLIMDLWECENLDDVGVIELALRRAVQAAGARLLHLHLHRFGSGGGVSGVAVLAESHISIHTWPERSYAAIDAFMCGSAEPHEVVPILRHAFKARRIALSEHLRGVL
jgi:S-adenosylmethionine decarboxylase